MANKTRALASVAHSNFLGYMFCREACEVALFDGTEKIGGPGKLAQVGDGKIKR